MQVKLQYDPCLSALSVRCYKKSAIQIHLPYLYTFIKFHDYVFNDT